MTDVIGLIERDHRDLEEQLAKLAATHDIAVAQQLLVDLDRHLGAEETVLYPVVARELPNGKLIAGECEDDHAELRGIVARIRDSFESDRLPGLVAELGAALDLHTDTEEAEMLPQVRVVLEPDAFVALGPAFTAASSRVRPAGRES